MINLFDMRHRYPKIIENDDIDWHLDDMIEMVLKSERTIYGDEEGGEKDE